MDKWYVSGNVAEGEGVHLIWLRSKGFNLIELMIVVAIVGILATVAIPAYNNYVTRSRRSDAFTALETVRAAQEMYRAEKGFYSGGFADLAGCDTGMAGDNYTVSIARTDSTHYMSTAQAQAKQAGDRYSRFRVNQDGTQSYYDTDDSNWHTGDWESLR